MEVLKTSTDIDMLAVPYKGQSPRFLPYKIRQGFLQSVSGKFYCDSGKKGGHARHRCRR